MNDTQFIHTKITGLFNHSDHMAIDALARTIWGEARGQGVRGMQAVAHVVQNRVDIAATNGGMWWGNDVIAVCRKPHQFSCWNLNDPNRAKLLAVDGHDAVFRQAVAIATRFIKGAVCTENDEGDHEPMRDPTFGATHYHHYKIKPKWATGQMPTCRIGDHVFYDLRKEN